jgi:hypothetical protein
MAEQICLAMKGKSHRMLQLFQVEIQVSIEGIDSSAETLNRYFEGANPLARKKISVCLSNLNEFSKVNKGYLYKPTLNFAGGGESPISSYYYAPLLHNIQ